MSDQKPKTLTLPEIRTYAANWAKQAELPFEKAVLSLLVETCDRSIELTSAAASAVRRLTEQVALLDAKISAVLESGTNPAPPVAGEPQAPAPADGAPLVRSIPTPPEHMPQGAPSTPSAPAGKKSKANLGTVPAAPPATPVAPAGDAAAVAAAMNGTGGVPPAANASVVVK